MAGGDLFGDLPPPTSAPKPRELKFSIPDSHPITATKSDDEKPSSSPRPLPPPPAIKSALKRPKAPSLEETKSEGKRLRFKTTTDASETQVIDAMKKIASHIKNPSKFSKASQLAMQLIQSGSVKPATSDHFFNILEVTMSSPTACNSAALRADYHALFSAAQDVSELFSKKQKGFLKSWTIRAVLANDLCTDDSFVFSKASGKVKEAISSLPVATKDDDDEEAATLDDQVQVENGDERAKGDNSSNSEHGKEDEEPDPFGLDALIPSTSKKEDRSKGKKVASKTKTEEEEEAAQSLRRQRQALVFCLETAARRYKTPWCQTVIDMPLITFQGLPSGKGMQSRKFGVRLGTSSFSGSMASLHPGNWMSMDLSGTSRSTQERKSASGVLLGEVAVATVSNGLADFRHVFLPLVVLKGQCTSSIG